VLLSKTVSARLPPLTKNQRRSRHRRGRWRDGEQHGWREQSRFSIRLPWRQLDFVLRCFAART